MQDDARSRPSPVTLVAAGLVILGLGLTSVSWWFLLLVGLGTFGPSVLRELGLVADRDEFEREADRRAGYHAFLVAGLTAFALVAWIRSGDRPIRDPQELATFFLALLWLTAFFSAQLETWGPRLAARWTLGAFGCAWLLFNVLGNTGSEWTGPTALILQSLLALPFFALAWAAPRWPRVAGGLLLAVAAGFTWLFGGLSPDRGLGLVTQAVTYVLFLGPLVASGLALLLVHDDREELDELPTGSAA